MQSFFKEEKTEKSKPYIVLSQFNQSDYLAEHNQTTGHCFAITHFWLLLHSFSPSQNITELARNEALKFNFIRNHFADIILMQKKCSQAFARHNKTELDTLSELGIHAFSREHKEASFIPLIKSSISNDASETLDERITKLIKAIEHSLHLSKERPAIEFNFTWSGPTADTKDAHSFGIIKNPCPGYEIGFFDSNYFSIAFKKIAHFLIFMKLHFKRYLTLDCIPTYWVATCPIALKPELEIIIDNFQRPTPSPKHHIIDIAPSPKRPT